MPLLDAAINFGLVFVNGNYSDTDTVIQLVAGQGVLLKDPVIFGEYDLSWLQFPFVPNVQNDTEKEIIRVVSLAGTDSINILRAQEGTPATPKITPGAQYVLVSAPNEKLVNDIDYYLTLYGQDLSNQLALIQANSSSIIQLQIQVSSQSVQLSAISFQLASQSAHLDVIDGEITSIYSLLQVQSSSIVTLNNEMQQASSSIFDLQIQVSSQSIELQQHSASIAQLQQQASQSIVATNVLYTNPEYPSLVNVQLALDYTLYVAPVITSFTNDVNAVEIGSTVTVVTLNWGYNKTMSTAVLTDAGSISPSLLTYPFTGLSLTSNKTYTLTAGDGTNITSANTTVSFQNKRFWGTNASTSVVDNDIKAMTQEFATSRNKSFTINGNGQYIYYCYPATFGIATFTVNGLLSTAWTLTVQTFTNAQGYSSSYNVYRTNTVQFGTGISIVVS